jgi:hypothetical protein
MSQSPLSDAETRIRGNVIAIRAILSAILDEARLAWGDEAADRIHANARARVQRTIHRARSEFIGEGADVPAEMDAAAQGFLEEVFSNER